MSTSSRLAKATYHPHGYGVSEGLARARRPFRTANVLTGAVIAGFTFSVYIYSIRAVKQDDFSDIELPSEESMRGMKTIEEEEADRIRIKKEMQEGFGLGVRGEKLIAPVVGGVDFVKGSPMEGNVVSGTAGDALWRNVRSIFGGKSSPSKIVGDAPPVENLGRVNHDGVKTPEKRLV